MSLGPSIILAAAAILLAGLAPSTSRANDVANPGFEDPITYDGAPYVGSWEGFDGGAGASAVNSTAAPRTGAQHLALEIIAVNNSFAGVLQDVAGLSSGQEASFSGWHMSPSSPFDVGVEIRIEWRDSMSNTEVSRTANLTPVPSAAYEPFVLTATVPSGADTARLVYAIQSFGPGATNTGTVYVDDVSFPNDVSTPVEETSWGRLRSLYR